jgi:hypothetical protein
MWRGERSLEVSRELPLTLVSRALSDVVRNGIDRTEKLRAEAERGAAYWASEGRVMAGDREVVRLVPHLDSSERLH